MTSAICFSKNRPAQLDLLLHSLALNAPFARLLPEKVIA